MENLFRILKKANVPPSMQRIKILEYLQTGHNHPTADMIYQALKGQMPTLSKTTVYNTLRILVEHNLISEFRMFENEVRYEYDPLPHIHFKCDRCGAIYDLHTGAGMLESGMIDGHRITCRQINLKGVCRACLKGSADA
ncbi:transcriptional repressor [bacterium]|nr:transcriptional repressor [bacterium]